MFPMDALKMLKEAKIENGEVSGEWTFTNRGGAFGIRYLGTGDLVANL